MDDALQAHFARIETALGTLVESIAAYNPSTQAALDLVAADDELSDGLDQLSYHQANHARILSLRAEADALEAQLKASVTTLANLRHELFQTPATTFTDDSRPVPVNELLAYARKIASYTVPPTYRELAPPKGVSETDKDQTNGQQPSSGIASSNGLGTPAVPNAPGLPPPVNEASKDAPPPPVAEPENEALKEVTEAQAEWVRKLQESGFAWTPWPGNDRIANGNLMQIQRHLLDYKKDPWKDKVPVATEDGEQPPVEDEKMEQVVEQKKEQSAAAAPAAAVAAPVRKESVVTRPPTEEKPREQFDLFDFDEEED